MSIKVVRETVNKQAKYPHGHPHGHPHHHQVAAGDSGCLGAADRGPPAIVVGFYPRSQALLFPAAKVQPYKKLRLISIRGPFACVQPANYTAYRGRLALFHDRGNVSELGCAR